MLHLSLNSPLEKEDWGTEKREKCLSWWKNKKEKNVQFNHFFSYRMYFLANVMENIITILAYLLDIFLYSNFHEICILPCIVYNELSDYQILSRKWLDAKCTKWLIHIDDVYPLCPVLLFHLLSVLLNYCITFVQSLTCLLLKN